MNAWDFQNKKKIVFITSMNNTFYACVHKNKTQYL